MSYLVNLALEGRAAIVIGGGEVAARKVEDLLAAKANVTVIAPQICDGIAALADRKLIVAHARPYRTGDLAGAFVAIAATDDEGLNARIYGDAAAMNLLVNVVDRPALCTFTVPATVHRGDLTIAIATEGRCPALSGILREELEERYGRECAELVSLFGELRKKMIELGWNGRRIRETLAGIYRDGVMERIAAGDQGLADKLLRELAVTGRPLSEEP
jgi:precorrin-2 dehydrogenase/sirohydrochlorin ferrochelatase